MHKIFTYIIAAVWFINGLYCKLLNYVPRHQEIVASILGSEQAFVLTKIIGILEIGMALWILSGYKSRVCAVLQITIILIMNILEFSLVPELLLHGRLNILFALLFSLLIWHNEFKLNKLHANT